MYQPYYQTGSMMSSNTNDGMTMSDLDNMLNRETEQNKTQGWNKLDKTMKIEKLNTFADIYGVSNNYDKKQIQTLKQFLRECLDKSKLKNTKDVHYNKITKEVVQIPLLTMNPSTHNFTLRNTEPSAATNKKTIRHIQPRNISLRDKKNIIQSNIPPIEKVKKSKTKIMKQTALAPTPTPPDDMLPVDDAPPPDNDEE